MDRSYGQLFPSVKGPLMDGRAVRAASLIHKPPRLKKIRSSFSKLKLVQIWFLTSTGQQTSRLAECCSHSGHTSAIASAIFIGCGLQWSSQSFSLQVAEGCCSQSCDSNFLRNTSIPAKDGFTFWPIVLVKKRGHARTIDTDKIHMDTKSRQISTFIAILLLWNYHTHVPKFKST